MTKHHRQLIAALVGEDDKRKRLYLTSASFHAHIDTLACVLGAVVDALATEAEAKREEIDQAVRDLEREPLSPVVLNAIPAVRDALERSGR